MSVDEGNKNKQTKFLMKAYAQYTVSQAQGLKTR